MVILKVNKLSSEVNKLLIPSLAGKSDYKISLTSLQLWSNYIVGFSTSKSIHISDLPLVICRKSK